MNPQEIRRLNETLKAVKLAQQARQIQQLQRLNAILKKIKDLPRQREAIKEFCEETRDDFWRGEKPTPAELESLREQTGYDKQLWADIVRELLGEPPPS